MLSDVLLIAGIIAAGVYLAGALVAVVVGLIDLKHPCYRAKTTKLHE